MDVPSMATLEERLLRCFVAVFPELGEGEARRASTASLGGWDSVASVTLLSVVEEEFGIEVSPEDLQQMTSFETILELVSRSVP